jgi:hypothetical protein
MSAKESFTADWLSLREPVDHAARSGALARIVDQYFGHRFDEQDRIRIADLGAGRGSNLRWLAPRLSLKQHWQLIDHDPDLLELAAKQSRDHPPARGLTLETRELDLATADLQAVTDCDLVTGSALLDLVSAGWMERLTSACEANRCAVFFALSVNGFWRLFDTNGRTIDSEDDIFVQNAFNRHQLRDKGLGAALGPTAADALMRGLAARFFRVDCRSSHWQLPPNHPWTLSLGPPLLDGWRQAASEQTGQTDRIDQWHRQRLDALLAGRLGLEVGHVDCLALPPA